MGGLATLGALLFLLLSGGTANAQISLTWDDNSSDEVGFKIERAGAGGDFVQIATVGANTVFYTDGAAHAGSVHLYRVRAFNAAGDSGYSNVASTAPVFSTQPAATNRVAPGGTATFTIAVLAPGSPAIAWQVSTDQGGTWSNLTETPPFSGTATTTLVIANVPSSLDGQLFRALATTPAGRVISNPGTLSVGQLPRLANISVRAVAGTANRTLIVGFVVAGASSKSLLIRGIGPTLGAFGVSGILADPVLQVFSGSQEIGASDDWGTSPNAAAVSNAGAALGAFVLPVSSRDAALLQVFPPAALSAQVTGKGGTTGIALLEVYDATPTDSGRLINVSARTSVGTGENAPIIGFVLAGNLPGHVLIRAIGPTLAQFGVTEVLADPVITLFRQGTAAPLQQNDNWGATAALKAAFAATGAFSLPDGSRDSALTALLSPGAYTAVVTGVGNLTGVALLEVYEIP